MPNLTVSIIDLKFQNLSDTIASFLVETVDGPVLIETGPHSTFQQLKKSLEAHHYSIDDVRHVLLTHIHFDHAGAAWALAERGANIYVHPNGAAHLSDPSKLYESAKRIYQDQMETLWGEMKPIPKKQIHSVKDKVKIKIGKTKFKALHTPGHANHHIAWQLGKSLFTGDVGGVKIKDGPVMPPCPPPDINLEAWLASLQMILSQRFEALYLTHFGKVTNVRNHVIELRGRLLNWANWMKPHLLENLTQDQILPMFQEYVHQQLRMAGVSEQDIQMYEGANPAWMSVAGLTRYWVKYGGIAYQP